MKILQEKKKLSEESAKRYLEEAEEAIKEIDKYSVFIKSLCEIISDLKKINASDDTIISKIQDKFHFDKDDAKFYYDYALKTHKNKRFQCGETERSSIRKKVTSRAYRNVLPYCISHLCKMIIFQKDLFLAIYALRHDMKSHITSKGEQKDIARNLFIH